LEIKNEESNTSNNSLVDNNKNKANSNLDFKEVFMQTSWKDRSLLAVSHAGLVNNLIFGVSWGLLLYILYTSVAVSFNNNSTIIYPEQGFLRS
jgi:hypothetical protein